MNGIKTEYKSCHFRSRLEAKWAVFFDLLGWKWEYEPFDLDGYIPDFILIGKNQTVLVEVKPYTTLEQFRENKVIKKVEKAVKKSDYKNSDILYLGCSLLPSVQYGDSQITLGWLSEDTADFEKEIGEAIVCEHNQNFDFCHGLMSFAHRMSGFYDGDTDFGTSNKIRVISLFNEAGSIVQWNKEQI